MSQFDLVEQRVCPGEILVMLPGPVQEPNVLVEGPSEVSVPVSQDDRRESLLLTGSKIADIHPAAESDGQFAVHQFPHRLVNDNSFGGPVELLLLPKVHLTAVGST